MVIGDFNITKGREEKIRGAERDNGNKEDFNWCCNDICIEDLRFTSPLFTQSNERDREDRSACKLDRVLVNENWIEYFPSTFASFKPNGISNHYLCVKNRADDPNRRQALSKFLNFQASHEKFLPLVKEAWKDDIQRSLINA